MTRKLGGHHPKAKGSEFERQVCKRLSLWVSGMTREDVFWRSSMSGGRATLARRRRKKALETQTGDISAIHPLGQPLLDLFIIECKCLKNLELHNPAFGVGSGVLMRIWNEEKKKAEDSHRSPMVIARQNWKGDVVVVDGVGAQYLRAGDYNDVLRPTAIYPRYGAHVYLFRDILKFVSFKDICRDYNNA